MATRKGRKITGGKYTKRRKKKSYEIAGQSRVVKIGNDKRKTLRVRGGNIKTFLLKGKFVNVRTDKGVSKVEIKDVVETPSNRFLARQDILLKGAIIKTDIGNIRITNRPSQEGVINGILVK